MRHKCDKNRKKLRAKQPNEDGAMQGCKKAGPQRILRARLVAIDLELKEIFLSDNAKLALWKQFLFIGLDETVVAVLS